MLDDAMDKVMASVAAAEAMSYKFATGDGDDAVAVDSADAA